MSSVRRSVISALFVVLQIITCRASSTDPITIKKIPIIDVTDLYHPYQDPGDNVDLVAAYALQELDLRAVILDVTAEYRKRSGQLPGLPRDEQGPRDPGFIQILQLNRIFNRSVPSGAAPFAMMKSLEDKMTDAPPFEQAGIDLLLHTLKDSHEPVEILSFGSGRPVAVAYNRDPDLFARKVKRIHLSAGSSEPGFMEWNVMLDQRAIVRLLRSKLPIAIYPCGTIKGAFAYGPGNTFWRLPDLRFVDHMAPPLRRYLAFTFERMSRPDFLYALEDAVPAEFTSGTLGRAHNIWETAIWLEVSGRRLVRRPDGHFAIVAANEVKGSDVVLPNELRPCTVDVKDNGDFTLYSAQQETGKWMYYRGDPTANESALREAFPAWYCAIRP